MSAAQHTFRSGAAFLPKSFDATDSTNFGGIFTFPDLPAFNAQDPVLFQAAKGTPHVSFTSMRRMDSFRTNELPATCHLHGGLRYDWQQHLNSPTHFAPRVAVGYAPGKGDTVLRAGAGIFYDRISDHVFEQTLPAQWHNQQEFILRHPCFPLSSLPESTQHLATGAKYSVAIFISGHAALSIRCSKDIARLRLNIDICVASTLFRALDVNAPLASGVRPDPSAFSAKTGGIHCTTQSNALIAASRAHIGKPIKFKAQYTYSRSDDNTDGPLALPADSRNLGPEWGRSDIDMRHRLVLGRNI